MTIEKLTDIVYDCRQWAFKNIDIDKRICLLINREDYVNLLNNFTISITINFTPNSNNKSFVFMGVYVSTSPLLDEKPGGYIYGQLN